MDNQIGINEIFSRWTQTLRAKAKEYEHFERKQGITITQPDIDSICNEMDAFLTGYNSK